MLKRMKRLLLPLATGFLALSFLIGAAAEEKKAVSEALPGVSADHKIVGPVPPEPTDVEHDPTTIRIGNTEVHISGYVQVDITAGKPGKSRH